MKGPTLVFLLMICGMTAGISFLAFALLKKVFPIYRKAKLAYAFWLVNLLALLGVLFGRERLGHYPFSALLVEWLIIWFMAQVFVILLLPGYFCLKKLIAAYLARDGAEVDLTRRRLIQGMALSAPVAAIGLSAYGTFYGSKEIRLRQHVIALPELDAALVGFKIAQISDAHIGLFFSVEKLRETLERLLNEQPDVLVITGDLIDDIAALPSLMALLDAYSDRFPQGIYFTWGNHEYFRDLTAIERAMAASRVQSLRNSSMLLADAAKPLYLIGVDYPWAKEAAEQEAECRSMLTEGLAGVPDSATKILLSHHPMFIDYAYERGIALSLTGHTHGGQFAVFGQALLPVRYKYMRGMYRQGGQYGYVSTGAGSWFPFRMGCPAEVAIFTLK